MIFVNSMSDLFHEKIPDAFIGKVFESMAKAKYHIFQVLSKRSDRMLAWVRSNFPAEPNGKGKVPWPANIWLGVSVENQDYTWRIKHLQSTPVRLRYLSVEPLLGPLSLNSNLLEGISWVIVGGESGPRARPMKGEWVADIRLQCEKYDIPFFFKQWGTYDQYGKRVGKKKAGRSLEGRTWNEIPTFPFYSVSETRMHPHSGSTP
jgi:protein gp37